MKIVSIRKLKFVTLFLCSLAFIYKLSAEEIKILLPYPTNIAMGVYTISLPSLRVDPITVASNRAWMLQGAELTGVDGVTIPALANRLGINTLVAVKADLDEAAQRFGYSEYGAVAASNLSQVVIWALTHKAGATLGYSGEILTNWVDTVVSNLAVYLQE